MCVYVRCRDVARAIEAEFPGMIVRGNELHPPRRGAFEITDYHKNTLFFSKLDKGSFPRAESVLQAMHDSGMYE